MPSDEEIHSAVALALGTLRAELAKRGWTLDENTIATAANVLRPLLGFAKLFAVKRARITDERGPKPLESRGPAAEAPDDEPNNPTL